VLGGGPHARRRPHVIRHPDVPHRSLSHEPSVPRLSPACGDKPGGKPVALLWGRTHTVGTLRPSSHNPLRNARWPASTSPRARTPPGGCHCRRLAPRRVAARSPPRCGCPLAGPALVRGWLAR
jgi:hypothetical protein